MSPMRHDFVAIKLVQIVGTSRNETVNVNCGIRRNFMRKSFLICIYIEIQHHLQSQVVLVI